MHIARGARTFTGRRGPVGQCYGRVAVRGGFAAFLIPFNHPRFARDALFWTADVRRIGDLVKLHSKPRSLNEYFSNSICGGCPPVC